MLGLRVFIALFVASLTLAPQTVWALTCRAQRLPQTDFPQVAFLDKGAGKHRWLGGDNANSIAIDSNRYLWTFGDTYWGRFPKGADAYRVPNTFSHGSVGIMDLNHQTMRFHSWPEKTNHTALSQRASNNSQYHWILSGAKLGKQLLLGVLKIQNTDSGFKIVDTGYVLLNKSPMPPKERLFKPQWLSEVLSTQPTLLKSTQWAVALIPHGHYLYMMGTRKEPSMHSEMYLARISRDKVLQGDWSSLAFWSEKDGVKQFRHALDEESALLPLAGLPSMSEGSFYYDKTRQMWYTLYIPFLGKNVFLYSATQLKGPWQNEGLVYSIPSPWSTTIYRGKSLFMSYAPKFHPELQNVTESVHLSFIFSYLNNLNEFELPGISQKQAANALKKYPLFYLPLLVKVSCS